MGDTRRQRRRLKLLSIALSASVAFTQVLFAHVPETSVWEMRRAQRAKAPLQMARLMDAPAPAVRPAGLSKAHPRLRLPSRHPAASLLKLLPPEIVTVRDVALRADAKGPLAGRRFVIVQDVHLNAEAQRNIADLLFRLMGAGETSLVAVEGAVGRFDLARFRRYPDKAVTDAVARAFLVSNLIGAPSYAGITSKAEPPLFWGVDDAVHYERNVDAYLSGRDVLPKARQALAGRRAALESAKASAYTPALRALDMAEEAYQAGERGLGEHLETLSALGALDLIGAAGAGVARRFLEAWRIERTLDFGRADKERRAALEKLVSKLNETEIDAIVSLSLGQREGRATFGDYHRAIAGLIESKGVSLDNLPAFKDYLRYALLSDGIDADALLQAARDASAAAFDKAAATPEQKRLVRETRRLTLTAKLLDFALTPSEWEEYEAGSGNRWAEFQPFENFYLEAHVRSEKIAANLADAASRVDGSKVGVLIIGGFHAPDVVKRVADMGASYALVSPKLTQIEAGSGTAYLSVFSREKTPLEKLFQGEKLFLYPAHLNVGANGPRTTEANRRFAAGQALASRIGVPAVDAAPEKFVERSAWRAAVSRARDAALAAFRGWFAPNRTGSKPVGMTRATALLARAFDLSDETAARLSFIEELFFAGVIVIALPWALSTIGFISPAMAEAARLPLAISSAALFSIAHPDAYYWTADGRIERRQASAGHAVGYLILGAAFRLGFFFVGADPALSLLGAVLAHAAWNNLIARRLNFLPVGMVAAMFGPAWWKDPSKTFVAMSVPIYALRRDPARDPGIGKFTDLGRTFREKLKPAGVSIVQLLPHYATLDESPYATVSLFAVQERYIDWSQLPETAADPDLLAALVAPAGEQNEVDYAALAAREDRVASQVFERFLENINSDRERAKSYRLFLREKRGWLHEYADFMAINGILGKPSLEWSEADVAAARSDARYKFVYDLHSFKQWIGYMQFAEALDEVQDAGGKVLIDVPFFRAKNSVAVRNYPQFFRDPKNRSAGIKNQWTDQTWGDLALWNWPELAKSSYDYMLGPIRHWLRFGVDGARNDALHFAYRIGQFGDNDEPGEAYVGRLASTFDQYSAFPLAEAFENKGDDVARHGFVTIKGNWQPVSTHDDVGRPHPGDPVNFMKDVLGRLWAPKHPNLSRFISFTLGDFDGDSATVKRMEDGRSLWRYRQSLTPERDLGRLVRFHAETLPDLRRRGRSIWEASDDLKAMFDAATESFVKRPDGRIEIWAASRDWFPEQWGRDTFIALPGILLTAGRFDDARALIRSFVGFEKNGLIPNRIPDPNHPEWTEYNTSDASMWFIQAIKSYVEATGDWAFVDEMTPVMRRVMNGYRDGTGWDSDKHINADPARNDRRIQMDPADGLISVPAQSTWMDADPHGQGPITPRSGKPVEINALWYANLRFMQRVAALSNDGEVAEQAAEYAALADKVKANFVATFWNDHLNEEGEPENALFDLAPGGPHNGAVRPNMLFAVSHGEDLLSPERQALVVERARKDLWTPFGPRTLSPRDSNYKGRYETDRQPYPNEPDFPNHKDRAYHQGTVWPWLIGAYVDALVKVRQNQGVPMFEIQNELRDLLEPIVNEFANQGSLHEVYDGSPRWEDARQHPGGTSSQAWSVGEVYRVISRYGLLGADAAAEDLDDISLLGRLRSIASNYQQNFRRAARELFERLSKLSPAGWSGDDRAEAVALIQEASDAFDWRKGWAAKSKHYPQFRNHPVFLLSMEARVSASQNAATRAEFEELRRNHHDRLTTNQGGLGDLAGGWLFGGLGDMGMATTFNPNSEAPEAYAFLPNYRHGSRLSRVDANGWPVPDSQNEAWSAVRPQDVGIGRIKDPVNPDQDLMVAVPVTGLGDVNVHFRAVEKDGIKIIMIETDGNEAPEKASIFDRMYQGSLSSEDRFRQQWVYGVAVQKFKERFRLPDGPIHLNETATFVTLIARVREAMERYVQDGVPHDVAYEMAMEQVGQQLIFFTHTLVEAGVDRFFSNIAFGDYVRELFEESPVLSQAQAWDATKWLVHGKRSSIHNRDLPGFWFDKKGEAHYSPLNFVANLAYQFNSEVVAVSRLNARKAGEFLSGAKILTPAQVAAKQVTPVTNAVDELFFYDRRVVKVMDLEAADPAKRHPERILNPNDPKARELHRIVTGGREIPADYTEAAMSDREYKAINDENRAKMVQRVRWAMQDQLIRNVRDLTEALKDQGLAPADRDAMTARLETLKKRWSAWTGQEFPRRLDDMRRQELVNLLDPKAMTTVWARRIVEYKRMLLSVFGENLPLVEKLVSKMPATTAGIDELIDTVVKEAGAASLDELVRPFIDLIEKQRMQMIFAGPTFDYKGRAMVAILDRVIERVSQTHPGIVNRVLYVEGYNDELSHYLVQGADIWLNNPKRPLEASGTSSMKRRLSATVLDGWAADNGFEDLNVIAIRPASSDLNLDHPDEWPAEERDPAKRARYLKEEAISLYQGLGRASNLFYNDPHEWMNFDRRAYFYNAAVFSVRSSFTGRYIPTSDPKISAAGWETGIFELYDRTIRRMDAARSRLAEAKRYARLKAGLAFKSSRPQLALLSSSDEIEASISFTADPALTADSDFYFMFGQRGSAEWKPVKVDESGVVRSESGVVTVKKRFAPAGSGVIGVTFFAVPKDSRDPTLRVWSARYVGDNAEFARQAINGGKTYQNVQMPSTPGLVGAWAAGEKLSLAQMTVVEGAVIGAALLAMMIFGASALPGATAITSVLATAALAAGLYGAHRALGVLQPDRSVVRDAAVVFRASLAASSSLLSAPLFALAASSLRSGDIVAFAAWAAAGFAVSVGAHLFANRSAIAAGARVDAADFPVLRKIGPLFNAGRAADGRVRDAKDPSVVFTGSRWHVFGTPDRERERPYHLVAERRDGPFRFAGWIDLIGPDGKAMPGRYEAPGVVFDPLERKFHLFAQTSFNALGGRLDHFVSRDGQTFVFQDTALVSAPERSENGLYDAHPMILPDGRKALTYASMQHASPDKTWADPDIYLAIADAWDGPWDRKGRILSHDQVPFHNPRGHADYEWGLEGPEILPLPYEGGHKYLLVGTAFLADGPRGTRQRVFLAVADRPEGPYSNPTPLIDPATDAPWAAGENGHASAAVVNEENGPRLLVYYQARAGAEAPWNVGYAEVDLSKLIGETPLPDGSVNGTAQRGGARVAADDAVEAVPLGLVGFWSHFNRLSFGRAADIESIGILGTTFAGLWLVLSHPVVAAVLAVPDFTLVGSAVRVSLVLGAAVFSGLLILHVIFGVVQPSPQKAPVWGWLVSLRATMVAMTTMVGFPLIALATIAPRVGIDFTAIGWVPIALLGAVIGMATHRSVNNHLLGWYRHRTSATLREVRLSQTVRQRIIERTRPVLDYLAERAVTTVGDGVEALRKREISKLPHGVTEPLNGSLADAKVDAMVVLGSHYLDVPINAARLYLRLREKNPDMTVVFAGGLGPRTELRFRYWSSEAELFRDTFINTIRLTRRAQIADRMRSMFSSSWGRLTETVVQFVLLIDDLLYPLHRSLTPAKVLIDPASTNTGENIANVTQLFRDNKLAPENVLLVTADVFQLRASLSWLQQYPLPMTKLYSVAANRFDSDEGPAGDLNALSDYDLAEIADESRVQIEKLETYPNAEPEPFSLPTEIPANIREAVSALTGTLEALDLVGIANPPKPAKSTRRVPVSYLLAAGAVLFATGFVALSVLPADATFIPWSAILQVVLPLSVNLLTALLISIGTYIILYSRSVGSFAPLSAPHIGQIGVLTRFAIPIGVGVAVFAGLSTFSGWPSWISPVVVVVAGVVLRSWSLSVDPRRRRELSERAPIPGAAGFWSKAGASLKFAGAAEGLATAVVAMSAMGAAAAVAIAAGDVSQILFFVKFVSLSAVGAGAGLAAIGWAHRRFGVTLRRGAPPVFDAAAIRGAVRTASSSLAAVPALAVGLLLPGAPAAIAFAAGLVLAVWPHVAANGKAESVALSAAERAEAAALAARLRELNDARKFGDEARLAAALSDLVALENAGLDAFGAEGRRARRADAAVAYQLASSEAAFVDWQFALSSAKAGRGRYAASTLEAAAASAADAASAPAETKRRDHIAVVAAGRDDAQLFWETERALDLAQGRPVTIILGEDGELSLGRLERAYKSRGVTFLTRADLSTAADIETRLLKPALLDSGRLKLLVHRESGLPDFLVAPLIELGKQDAYRDLVDVVIVAALTAGALAVRASLSDIERAVSFRELVLSQA